jgi:hypothetical protein
MTRFEKTKEGEETSELSELQAGESNQDIEPLQKLHTGTRPVSKAEVIPAR